MGLEPVTFRFGGHLIRLASPDRVLVMLGDRTASIVMPEPLQSEAVVQVAVRGPDSTHGNGSGARARIRVPLKAPKHDESSTDALLTVCDQHDRLPGWTVGVRFAIGDNHDSFAVGQCVADTGR